MSIKQDILSSLRSYSLFDTVEDKTLTGLAHGLQLVILEVSSESILLVDDEEPIVRMVKMMLEKLGGIIFQSQLSSPGALDAFRANR